MTPTIAIVDDRFHRSGAISQMMTTPNTPNTPITRSSFLCPRYASDENRWRVGFDHRYDRASRRPEDAIRSSLVTPHLAADSEIVTFRGDALSGIRNRQSESL